MTTQASSTSTYTAPDTTTSFEELGLTGPMLQAVFDLAYTSPTPVQEAAIPAALSGADVLAAAQTGTGKTAAFLLPTLARLEPLSHKAYRQRGKFGPQALIITPTRELASQIETNCRVIAKRTGHRSVTVVGGVSYNPQRSALKRGCDILVATPGRLEDLLEQGACKLDQVQTLVLDEADRMLDMGFLPTIKRLVHAVPKTRQTLLFSATLDDAAIGSIKNLVHNPVHIEIAPRTSTAETVEQFILPVSLEAKNRVLPQLLKRFGSSHVIVFCRTKRRADTVCKRLVRAGIRSLAIHGDRSQAQRERALDEFQRGRIEVLVATDVLARGIDIHGVNYVVNFDVPEEPVDYIHRIGRTGRAGELGWSLTIVTEQDIDDFYDIEALMKKTAKLLDVSGDGLVDCGEHPVVIDPYRHPKARIAGKKEKKRRREQVAARIEKRYAQSGVPAGVLRRRTERASSSASTPVSYHQRRTRSSDNESTRRRRYRSVVA
ncbi:DEAD/DEAH box helicase [Collinsella sp. zg1085]|uniref:DEAD/DEAH box helicase n=1 Tax=Collinsella sp. zg1085 TaxID=2844380 RepID=UPI001C0CE00A|nr:DEAD/DEAH box helicase [Collinsella sp. zg1085]QWT18155.1 DEAD/DEAH box helicase [Collinsella sp. zg1085]